LLYNALCNYISLSSKNKNKIKEKENRNQVKEN